MEILCHDLFLFGYLILTNFVLSKIVLNWYVEINTRVVKGGRKPG